jgi:hypothetical protein
MKTAALSTAVAMALAAATAFVAPQALAAEIYGTQGQGYYIPAYKFTPISANCTLEYHSWYYYRTADSGAGTCTTGVFFAQVELPEGARVNTYAIFAYDNAGSANLTTTIQDSSATYGTTALPASWSTVPNSSVSTAGASTDYQLLGSTPINKTIDSFIFTIHHDFAFTLSMPKDADLRFRGAWIFWNRQIAPAPATASFADVPTSHPFFNEVQQLAEREGGPLSIVVAKGSQPRAGSARSMHAPARAQHARPVS